MGRYNGMKRDAQKPDGCGNSSQGRADDTVNLFWLVIPHSNFCCEGCTAGPLSQAVNVKEVPAVQPKRDFYFFCFILLF